jgi:hypothetical protein
MVRSCKVTISDIDGIAHIIDVTAETLYEAVALGLAAVRRSDWATGIAEGYNVVQVSVTEIPVKHAVRLKEFNAWLERSGGSPRDVTQRLKIKSILGMPTGR